GVLRMGGNAGRRESENEEFFHALAMLPAVRGSVLTRTPSASCSALAIAATVGPMVHSPAPREGCWFFRIWTSTGGASLNLRIGYSSQPTVPGFHSSFSAQLVACTQPPSIWLATPSGLTGRPTSTAATRRVTFSSAPLASTSATTAQ